MKSTDALVKEIILRLEHRTYAQVPGYNRFGYIRKTEKAVLVSRETGKDTPVPFEKIAVAIQAVRDDREVYARGPSALRPYGITHINSPIWAMLHLLDLKEITQ